MPNDKQWLKDYKASLGNSRSRMITFNGKTQPLVVWAKELGLPYSRVKRRLQLGWSVDRVFSKDHGWK